MVVLQSLHLLLLLSTDLGLGGCGCRG